MNLPQKPKDKSALTPRQIIAIAVTFLCVIGLWYWNYDYLHGKTDAGTTGDMFGAVNALFSGLAFAGIIFTILLQRNELQLQRKEIEETREEFIKQNKTLKQQRFENTFFNMLNLQNEIVRSMKAPGLESRELINAIADHGLPKFLVSFTQYKDLKKEEITEEMLSKLDKELNQRYKPDFYSKFENNFNHYFRHLYHIYKFIYFSDLTLEEKNFYASLARAPLSQSELFLIAINGIIEDYGYPKFTYLIKEFDILKNFGWESINILAFQQLIQYTIATVDYQFKMEKPEVRNID